MSGNFHRWFIACIFLCGLSSCVTQRTATKYMNNHSFAAANYCHRAFPCTGIVKPGKIIHTSDTVVIPGDIIQCPDHIADSSKKVLKCPPNKIIRDSFYLHDTIQIIDNAQIHVLQDQILAAEGERGKLSEQVKTLKNGRDTWRWIGILALSVILAALAVFITVKFKL